MKNGAPGPDCPGPDCPDCPGPNSPGPHCPGPHCPWPDSPGPDCQGPNCQGPDCQGPDCPGPHCPAPNSPEAQFVKKESWQIGPRGPVVWGPVDRLIFDTRPVSRPPRHIGLNCPKTSIKSNSIFAGLENIASGNISIEFDAKSHAFSIDSGCQKLSELCNVLNDMFLIDGVQILEVKYESHNNSFKGPISWKKNHNFDFVIFNCPPLLALQCGLKKYEHVVNLNATQTEIKINNDFKTFANLLTGLNVLNIMIGGIFPIQNYSFTQIHISDGQLNSLLSDETKVFIKPFSSSFMINHFNPNGMDFEICNDLIQPVKFAYCNICVNLRRVSLKR